jgi:hypothetical protein
MIKFIKEIDADPVTTQVADYLIQQGYHFEIRDPEIVSVLNGEMIFHHDSRPAYNLDDPVFLLVRDTLRHHIWRWYQDKYPSSVHGAEVKFIDGEIQLRIFQSQRMIQVVVLPCDLESGVNALA